MKSIQNWPIFLVVILAMILVPRCVRGSDKGDGQKRIVRVGVAITRNLSGHVMNANWERDQLTRELERQGKSRKSPVVIEPVALDASSREDAGAEAAKKDCRYFVMTTLMDVSSRTIAIPGAPGTQRPSASGQSMPGQNSNMQQTAVIEYDIYEVGSFGSVGDGHVTSSEDDDVGTRAADEAMRIVAARVVDKLKK